MQKCGSEMVEFECRGYRRNVRRFQGGLVFQAHRLLCHSSLGSRVIEKRKSGDEAVPMSSKCGTRKTIAATIWPWRSGKSPPNQIRKREEGTVV